MLTCIQFHRHKCVQTKALTFVYFHLHKYACLQGFLSVHFHLHKCGHTQASLRYTFTGLTVYTHKHFYAYISVRNVYIFTGIRIHTYKHFYLWMSQLNTVHIGSLPCTLLSTEIHTRTHSQFPVYRCTLKREHFHARKGTYTEWALLCTLLL